MNKSIIVSNGSDTKTIQLDPNSNPIENLLTQISDLFSLNIQDFNPNLGSFKLVYKDDMDSDISISSNEELGYAMQYSVQIDPLALYVVRLKFKKEKNLNKNRERREKKFSNHKVYGSLEIDDLNEIELYKSVLIELDECGFRRFKSNLKFLKEYRQGNDFTDARNKIMEFEEGRRRERKLKRGGYVNNPEDEEIEDNNVNEVDERESNSESGKGEQEVVLNPEFMVLTDWPEDITHLYIDGNNLLYIAKNIRNMTIRRKGNKAQEILVGSFEFFSSFVKGLESVFIIFDYTSSVYEKTVGVNTRFTITSARPQFTTSDDALVSVAEKIQMKDRSLFVTSDRGLCSRLLALGSKVVKPKTFFNIVISIIYGKDININLDDYFMDMEKKLDLVQRGDQ